MGEITNRVQRILNERKERLPEITDKIKELKEIEERVDAFDHLKNQIVDSSGQLIEGSPYYDMCMDNPEMQNAIAAVSTSAFKEKLKEAKEKYEELRERFSREYVNIAVVGPARQGKSRFLQSISGLDDKCIPAFGGSHCTGASSTIENGDNKKVCVELTYKTEREMRDEINGYLNIITDGNKQISNVDEVKNITMDQLTPGPEDEDKIKKNEKAGILCERYVANYDKWRSLVGRSMDTMEDEDTIMTYVAQHNGKKEFLKDGTRNGGFHRFYKFVAVKSARIIKKFKYEDCGKIKMIDTVGLGSTETNTEISMLDVIRHESDGVIFFKRPEAATAGTNDQQEEEIYNTINNEFGKRDMNKWFAYVINHTCESKDYHDNIQMCMSAKEKTKKLLPLLSIGYKDEYNDGTGPLILDVSDAEAVQNNFLVPYLTQLSNNIGDIDRVFVKEVNNSASEAFYEYDKLCSAIENVISGKVKNSVGWFNTFKDSYKVTYNNMVRELKKFLEQWRELKNGTYSNLNGEDKDPSSELEDKMNNIINNINNDVPDKETIQHIIDKYPTKQPYDFMQMLMNNLRTNLTSKYIDIDTSLDEMLAEFKNKIVDILTSDEGGRLKYIVPIDPNKPKYEWLADFANEVLDDDAHREIKTAFEFLYDFDISVRGFMMHKIRIQLDTINPSIPEAVPSIEGKDVAQAIYFKLSIKAQTVKENLMEALEGFVVVPNEAFYAVIDEFFDRVTFSEDVQSEWENLYNDKAARVWADKFSQIAKQEVAFGDWNTMVERIGEKVNKQIFVMKE